MKLRKIIVVILFLIYFIILIGYPFTPLYNDTWGWLWGLYVSIYLAIVLLGMFFGVPLFMFLIGSSKDKTNPKSKE